LRTSHNQDPKFPGAVTVNSDDRILDPGNVLKHGEEFRVDVNRRSLELKFLNSGRSHLREFQSISLGCFKDKFGMQQASLGPVFPQGLQT
jgi:hypothetical protein